VHELGRLLRLDVVDHRRQWVVLHIDELGGVLRDVPALRDHQGDEVADEAHVAVRHRRPWCVGHILAHGRVPRLTNIGVEIRRDEDGGNARELQRSRRVDVDDTCAGERATNEARVEHAGTDDIVDERAMTGE
jgi:hypothetical protein